MRQAERHSSPRSSAALRALAVGLVLCATAFPARASEDVATLSGTVVVDPGDTALPGVVVTLRDEERGSVLTVTTDERGAFRFTLLRPASYTVTAELAGLAPWRASGVKLFVGQEIVLRMTLRVGAAADVQVTAGTELIDPTTYQVSTIITPVQLSALPLPTRNYLDLALLAPGTVPGRDVAFSGRVAGGAQEARWTNVSVDGVDNNNFTVGGQTANISPDTVAEFQVLSNNFSAEFTRSSSLVINVVTKSGTNAFHGAGYYYYRSSDITAQPFFPNQPNDYFRENWGGALGGPIVRDKAFFFGSFDRLYTDPLTVVNIPSRPDLSVSVPQVTSEYLAFAKVDINASPQHQLTLSYRYDDRDKTNLQVGGNFAVSYGYAQATKVDGFNGQWRWAVSRDAYNDLRLSALLFDQTSTPNSTDVGLQYPSYSAGGNPRFPQGGKENRYAIDDTFAVTLGSHFLKAGAGFARWGGTFYFNLYSAGQYTFRSDAANAPPVLYVKGSGDPTATHYINFWGFFLQDEWRVSNRLTLNLGIRYDLADGALNSRFVFPIKDANGKPLVQTPAHEDGNNIAPRLGFAWDVTGKGTTIARGGAGMFYTQVFYNIPLNETIFNAQKFLVTAYPCFAIPGFCNGVTPPDISKLPPIPVAPETRPMDPNFQTPYTISGSVGVAQAIGREAAVSADFVYTAGRHAIGEMRENLRDPNNPTAPRPIPQLGSIRRAHSDANSKYYGLLTSIRKLQANNWQAQLSYTLSWAYDEVEFFAVNVSDARSSDPFGQDYARARNDQRHRLVANGSYDFFPDSQAAFSLATIITYGTGRPYARLLGYDANLDDAPPFGQDRPAGYTRNSETSKSYFRWDLRLSKRFMIGPVFLDLIAELFNVTNTKNYDPDTYQTIVSASDFGQPRPSSNDFYQARQLQLSARVSF